MERIEMPVPKSQLQEQREEWMQYRTIEGWICSHRRDVPLRRLQEDLPFGGKKWWIISGFDSEVTESEYSRIGREIDAYEKAKRGLA